MSNELFSERPTKRKGKERAVYDNRKNCPECKGRGHRSKCQTCSPPRLCPTCRTKMHRNSELCRKCYDRQRRPGSSAYTGGSAAWDLRDKKLDKAKKAKDISILSATDSRVIDQNSIVTCYYFRTKRLNILAWKASQARDWARKNKYDTSEVIQSVCRVREINVDLTGALNEE